MRLTKNILAVVLTVTMVIGMSLLPVSAEMSVEDEYISVYIDGSGKVDQSQYGENTLDPVQSLSDIEPKVEKDATLNRDVMVFDATGSYKLGVAMVELSVPQDYAFEMLLWVSSEVKDQTEVDILGNCSNDSGTGIWVKNGKLTVYAHDGEDYQAVEGPDCVYDQWIHIVGVHDDTENTLTLYLNGENCGTKELAGPVKFWERYNATSDKLVLGSNHDYGGGGGFVSTDAFKGKVAYAKVYDTLVTAEDAAALYAASGLKSDGDSTTTSPSASASTTPSDGNGGTTAAPTKEPNQPNAGTFDMGVVSFAAVALSSLVAIKKRK